MAVVREIHGVANVPKVVAPSRETQTVLVADGEGKVLLELSAGVYPAVLTPTEARFIARALLAAAERIAPEGQPEPPEKAAGSSAHAPAIR